MEQGRVTAARLVESHAGGARRCEETIARLFARLPAVQSACNAFTEWFEAEALETARGLDRELADGGPPRPLHGVPVCIKDMTPSKGHHTTLGSWSSGAGETDDDAVIVRRLKQAGAVVVAKTTTAELAYSSFTSTKRYGVTRNPWKLDRTCGGSSGGSAAAVATALTPIAEGTDMGGSVRIPAGACGVVGFKPSLGRIPMDITPNALDTISHFGPLAGCVDDAARFVDATAGFDPADMLSQPGAFDYAATTPAPLDGKRIALSVDLGYCRVDPEIEARLLHVAELLRAQGAVVEAVDLPWSREIYDQWAIRWFSLLALFPNTQTDAEKAVMDPALVACLEQGRGFSAVQLMGVDVFRKKMNRQLNEVLGGRDALICPTNAVPAPFAHQSDADFEQTLEDGRFGAFDMAHPFNMVPSRPALSLPIGLSSERLPIGMQIVGRPYADEETLALSAAIETLVGPLPVPEIPKRGDT